MIRISPLMIILVSLIISTYPLAAQDESSSEYKEMNEELNKEMNQELNDKLGDLEKSTARIDSFDLSLKEINLNIRQLTLSSKEDSMVLSDKYNSLESRFEELLASLDNNQASYTELSEHRQARLKNSLEDVSRKIVGTSEFVKSANVSLNALILSNALTEYLNQVADLNNPNNTDLGFSITDRVLEMVENDVLSHSKKQRKNKGVFLQIVESTITNPLIQALTVPVSTIVNSLSDVSNTVTQTALNDDDIQPEHLEDFKNSLRKYVKHYQGLTNATAKFDKKISHIDNRIIALQQLLFNFTSERITTLFPDKNINNQEYSLTNLIGKEYNFRHVEKEVNNIKDGHGSEVDLSVVLADNRLQYPVYAISQCRLIYDEIDALFKEYLIALQDYQTNIEKVLDNSRELGDNEKIDQKITSLKHLHTSVNTALRDAVNIEDVEQQFFNLSQK